MATAQAAEGFFAHVFTPPDDEQESAKVFNVLEQIGKGRPLQEIAPELSANTRFYILGLAPNAARFCSVLAGHYVWAAGGKFGAALARFSP